MPQAAGCRILAIMGSGETSPTMVTMHRTLVARLEIERPAAVLLETPYLFQENASDISARAQAYFARSVGLDVTAQPGMRPSAPGDDGGAGTLRAADWVFAGPGSPSYALTEWRDSPVADAIRDALAAAGLELQDTAGGTQWQLAPPGQPLGLTPSAAPYLDR